MLMSVLATLGISVFVFLSIKFYCALRTVRARYVDVPGLPHDPIWGHMKGVGEYTKDDRHIDYVNVDIWNNIGRPPFFFLDVWPIMKPNVAIISDAELAERLFKATPDRPYSYPKGPEMDDLLSVLGPTSMLSANGEKWKTLRRRYNPGFSSRHLQSFLPEIVHETEIFMKKLEAAVGQIVTLGEMTTAMTIDIICVVVLGHSLNAQSAPNDLVNGFKGCLDWQIEREKLNPFHLYNPIRPLAMFHYERKLNGALDQEIKAAFRNRGQLKPKSIVGLTLADLQGDTLRPEDLATSRDQIKTFLLAGHDTTSTALQWTYYELSQQPHVLARMRKEHETIFGVAPAGYSGRVTAMFLDHPEIVLQQMTYTTAVFKEVLRVHPVASATKFARPGTNLSVVDYRDGREYLMDDHLLATSQSIMNIDQRWWGPDAEDFNPDRFLEGAAWKLPPFAFRAFERGPRACIGQELVYLEAKVILALTIHSFEFEKVFDGRYQELYNVRKITAHPNDGMRMRVKRALV